MGATENAGVWPYPRETTRREPDSGPGVDPPAPVATCGSCRRSVTPQLGTIGLQCPRCGGLLPQARMPKVQRKPRTAAEQNGETAAEVAEQLLAEAGRNVTTVAEYLELHEAATRVVAEVSAEDRERTERAQNARYWRQRMTELI